MRQLPGGFYYQLRSAERRQYSDSNPDCDLDRKRYADTNFDSHGRSDTDSDSNRDLKRRTYRNTHHRSDSYGNPDSASERSRDPDLARERHLRSGERLLIWVALAARPPARIRKWFSRSASR